MLNNITINNPDINDNSRYFKKSAAIAIPADNSKPYNKKKHPLSQNERLGINMCTALGIIGSIALLAKTSKTKYSFNLKKMAATPFKDTFLGKEVYGVKNVLTIGAGSCIGGYVGGMIFDKNKGNRQAKKREALIQYTNISLPILTVAMFSMLGEVITKKLPKSILNSSSKFTRFAGKVPEMILPMIGLGAGMVVGNKAANKLNQKIFNSKDNRPVELGDFSAHLDDICMTSQYIAKNNILTKSASRFIPLALMVAGNEIGKKQEKPCCISNNTDNSKMLSMEK